MDDLLKNILYSKNVNLPEKVKASFDKYFYNPLNVEWFNLNNTFEAIFHEDELEKIAMFDTNGDLLEEKVNLGIELLPARVKMVARNHGELMNSIRIKRKEEILFEIIYRDKELDRYLLLLDRDGKVLNKEKL